MAGIDIVGTSHEILRLLDEAKIEERQVMVYPDLQGFRTIYAKYVKKHLKEDNEVVLLLPYYETVDNVLAVLQKNGIDVGRYGGQGFLLVRDAYKTYSGFVEDRELFFRRIIAHAVSSGKSGISIIVDMGAFSLIADFNRMAVSYQSVLPPDKSLRIRGLLSYHKNDYAKLSQDQKSVRFTENYRSLLLTEY